MTDPLQPLLERLSIASSQLTAPGPDPATLERLIHASIRVPDHGKLVPFRLIRLSGEAKQVFGARLAALALARNPDLPEAKRLKEERRYTYAPLVLIVVASLQPDSSIPVIEQQLTAGCVAYNLLLGAQALGFGAQWLTGWAAHDPDAAKVAGLQADEQIIGFVHIGTPTSPAIDRPRPSATALTCDWVP
ncbi:nitroreductase family protein [Frateuria aurantia]